jgi:hypothetical protein
MAHKRHSNQQTLFRARAAESNLQMHRNETVCIEIWSEAHEPLDRGVIGDDLSTGESTAPTAAGQRRIDDRAATKAGLRQWNAGSAATGAADGLPHASPTAPWRAG